MPMQTGIKPWQIALAMLMAAALLAWAAHWSFTTASEEKNMSLLGEPEQKLLQDPQAAIEASLLSQHGLVNPDRRFVIANLHGNDKFKWQSHLANIAAQKGWLAHKFEL